MTYGYVVPELSDIDHRKNKIFIDPNEFQDERGDRKEKTNMSVRRIPR